jgi:triphosphoribosyl-dephospho-CoA synthase
MALAADRDAIARQYVNGFADVLDRAAPCLSRWLTGGHPLETAIVATHLTLLNEVPDTLIARKRGAGVAAEASRRAGAVLAAGWPDGEAAPRLCEDLDRWLRADGHARNPGTTADLVTAALFVALRDGTIRLPFRSEGWAAVDRG